MQGRKEYQEELFVSFQLSDRVPENNFYRRLKDHLHLDYLYKLTAPHYGSCGQKSIDPVVFFKLCLVGYLENITSDRALMNHCAMRLDILFFLGYNISEPLPWHSTLSRTRDLLPEEVFAAAFGHVLAMCVEKGMVGGHTQAIDSAPVKANASMDSLELKVPHTDLEEHLRRVRAMSAADRQPKTGEGESGRGEGQKPKARTKAQSKKQQSPRRATQSDGHGRPTPRDRCPE